MKSKQYRVVDKETNKVKGYLVGKTPNNELVLHLGNKTFTIPVNKDTEAKYKIEVLEVSTK